MNRIMWAASFLFAHREDTAEEKSVLSTFASIGRFHITIIAALGVFTFGRLFTGGYPWLITGICALDWYMVNLINRVVDIKEDRESVITGTGFIRRNRRMLMRAVLFILIVSIIAVHFLDPAITSLRIACHVLGAFYNWPILPGRRRLKQLYFWKNNASAVGFLMTVFGYPLASARWGNVSHHFPMGISWATVAFSAVFFFLFVLSYEVIYDMRDVKGDALADIRTYPVVHGMRTSVIIIDLLIFFSMAVLATGFALGFVPWRICVMIFSPALQFVFYKHALRRGISARDCIMITWLGASLLLVYNLWVIAGLPGAGL